MRELMPARYGIVPEVRKIAVLRANAIGDFLLTLPALEALRETYSSAEIVLLAKEWHARFLTGRPGPVDRVVVVPQSKGVNEPHDAELREDPDELERFFATMQREHFDIAVQLHGGGRYSNPFVWRLGARLTVGSKTPDAVALDRWVPYTLYQHETLRFLEIVALVGATTSVLEPRIAVTARDLAEAAQVVPPTHQPLVAIHPGANDVRRQWPPERFAVVGDALAAEGAQVVVVGTAAERHLTEAVVNAMSGRAQSLSGQLSLGGLAGLLSRCRLLVGNDSGPAHLARAVGTATVRVYWIGNLINAGPLMRTRHRPAISWRLHCPVCGVDCTRDECVHRESFVADVSVEDVLAPALELFDGSRGRVRECEA